MQLVKLNPDLVSKIRSSVTVNSIPQCVSELVRIKFHSVINKYLQLELFKLLGTYRVSQKRCINFRGSFYRLFRAF